MDETILVKAGEKRRVLTPQGQDVPGEPFKVKKNDPYWARALRAGDLVLVDEKTLTKPVATKPVTAAPAPSKKEDKS